LRVAALYDVHGMPWALEAVLGEVEREGVDAIVFGGDLVWGPLPKETLELVRSVEATCIRGNCDREPDEWERGLLDPGDLAWLTTRPPTEVIDDVLYCHATPRSDEEIVTPATPDDVLDEILSGVPERLVVAGHTHMQHRRGRYVNAGSVGMPYEDDVAAFWAIVGEDVEFRRTPFDVERAAAEIRASGWPRAEDFVAENVLAAASRAEAIAQFESMRE
jgi:predicted phosphodiesterase